MSKALLAHIALFMANLIYGINYTVAKEVMPDYMTPLAFIMVRILGALVLFLLVSTLFFNLKVARKDLLRLFACGAFGVAINQMLFFLGLNLTEPINAAIIMTSNPILVLIMASLILGEVIKWRRVIGIVLGLAGALFLILYQNSNGGVNLDYSSGDVLVFLNASSYAVYLVLVKPLMSKYPPIVVITWVFLFGSMVAAPFCFPAFLTIDWLAMPSHVLWAVVFVVLGTTFLAYLFNIFALRELSPSTVSIYIYTQPVLASVVAIGLGKDQLDVVKMVSALLIFTGVYLVSNRRLLKRKGN